MVIQIDAELETALGEAARQTGVTTEKLALDTLRQRFLKRKPFQPRDEWERRLLGIGVDCGVSLSNEALSREELYD